MVQGSPVAGVANSAMHAPARLSASGQRRRGTAVPASKSERFTSETQLRGAVFTFALFSLYSWCASFRARFLSGPGPGPGPDPGSSEPPAASAPAASLGTSAALRSFLAELGKAAARG